MEFVPLSDQHTVAFNVDLTKVPATSPHRQQQNARASAPSFMTFSKSPAKVQPADYPRVPLVVTISRVVSLILAIYGIIVLSYRFSDPELMEVINYDIDLGGVSIPVLPGVGPCFFNATCLAGERIKPDGYCLEHPQLHLVHGQPRHHRLEKAYSSGFLHRDRSHHLAVFPHR